MQSWTVAQMHTNCEHSPGLKCGEMIGGGEIKQNKGSAEEQKVFRIGYKNSSTSSVKCSAHTADPPDCSSLAHIHPQNVLTHELLTKNLLLSFACHSEQAGVTCLRLHQAK